MLAKLAALGINAGTLVRKPTLESAWAYALTFEVVRRIVLGCDGTYWIVSPRDAARLDSAGYEVI